MLMITTQKRADIFIFLWIASLIIVQLFSIEQYVCLYRCTFKIMDCKKVWPESHIWNILNINWHQSSHRSVFVWLFVRMKGKTEKHTIPIKLMFHLSTYQLFQWNTLVVNVIALHCAVQLWTNDSPQYVDLSSLIQRKRIIIMCCKMMSPEFEWEITAVCSDKVMLYLNDLIQAYHQSG